MWKNHAFSILVGVGIGLALNYWHPKEEATCSAANNITIPSITTGNNLPWKAVPSLEEQPSLKQKSRTNRLLEAREAIDREGGGTRVVSDFIQDLELLRTLTEPQLWLDCERDAQVKFLKKGQAPSNVWEELALQIWQNHPLLANAAGFEYWCNIITPGSPLDWHVDKDEVLDAHTDKVVYPIMGAVFYGYPHVYRGGYLEVLPKDPTQVPDPEEYYESTSNVERFQAQYNRMLILNVSQWHRVTPITAGARFTFACNIWKERPKEKKDLVVQ